MKPTPADQARHIARECANMKNKSPYTPAGVSFSWEPEIIEELEKIDPKTIAWRDARRGMDCSEPLLVMMNAALRLVKAYKARFEQPLAFDYMAAPEIGGILSGIRGMLNFDGAEAWERQTRDDAGHDSKCNSMMESLYWKACNLAGLDGDAL